jgi:hypothetical protein
LTCSTARPERPKTRRIIDNPDVKAQIAQIGFEVFGSTPEELGALVKVQPAKTGQIVADAGIEPERGYACGGSLPAVSTPSCGRRCRPCEQASRKARSASYFFGPMIAL